MSANITFENKKVIIDGRETTIGNRVFTRQAAWHEMNKEFVGRDWTFKEAGWVVDDIEVSIKPLMADVNGTPLYTRHGFVMRHMPDGTYEPFGTPVLIGDMDEVRALNPDMNSITRSPHWNLITPQKFIEICDKHILDSNGNKAIVESMGLLGKHGSDGMFSAVRLPSWDIGGEEVQSYLTLFNPIRGGSTVHVYTTDIYTVCQNTLYWGMKAAKSMIQLAHHTGAEERFAQAISTVWGGALAAQKLSQEAVEILAKTRVTDDEVREVINSTFKLPRMINWARDTKMSDETRAQMYSARVADVKAMREDVFAFYQSGDRQFGILPEHQGTALAAWQSHTFFATYHKGRVASTLRSLIKGERRQWITSSFNGLMAIANPNYVPAPVEDWELEAEAV